MKKIPLYNQRYFILGVFFLILQLFVIIENYNASKYDTFFWFCNHALLLFAIGFFTKNNDLIKGLINVGLLAQLVWSIDFLSRILFEIHVFNITNYIFESPSSLWTLLTITIHLFATTLSLYITRNIKPTNKTLLYSILYTIILYISTIIFTLPQNNINWSYEIGGVIGYSSPLYTLFWPFIVIIIIILPTQTIQCYIYKKTK